MLPLHALTFLAVSAHLASLPAVRAFGANVICNKIPGLSPRQRTLCVSRPDAMAAVGEGDRLALVECRYQFRNNRWNCTNLGAADSLVGYVSPIKSREVAYSYAIRSAAIAYTITQACSQGNLSSCGCDRTTPQPPHDSPLSPPHASSSPGAPPPPQGISGGGAAVGWKWGGCSADVAYGLRFSRMFVDSREIDEDSRALMNKHNNAAGRKATRALVRTECRCNGVSGSCTLKTCWKTLPRFRVIADTLTLKYSHHARCVEPIKAKRAMMPVFLKLCRSKQPEAKPRRTDLVYLDDSPSYCELDPAVGSLGTRGRACNSTSRGEGGCEHICCGRGYSTMQVNRVWQCNCKFHWCCKVTCQQCRERTEVYTCK